MVDTQHECKVIRTLVTSHAYGSPLSVEEILRRAAIPSHEMGAAKEAVDAVRSRPFIRDCGSRGLMLATGEFGNLVQFLYDECGWERFELELRLKHFEGWNEIDWE